MTCMTTTARTTGTADMSSTITSPPDGCDEPGDLPGDARQQGRRGMGRTAGDCSATTTTPGTGSVVRIADPCSTPTLPVTHARSEDSARKAAWREPARPHTI